MRVLGSWYPKLEALLNELRKRDLGPSVDRRSLDSLRRAARHIKAAKDQAGAAIEELGLAHPVRDVVGLPDLDDFRRACRDANQTLIDADRFTGGLIRHINQRAPRNASGAPTVARPKMRPLSSAERVGWPAHLSARVRVLDIPPQHFVRAVARELPDCPTLDAAALAYFAIAHGMSEAPKTGTEWDNIRSTWESALKRLKATSARRR